MAAKRSLAVTLPERLTMPADLANETFRCRLCGGEDLTAIAARSPGDTAEFFRCRKCGLFNRDTSAPFALDGTDAIEVDPGDDTAPTNLAKDRAFRFLSRHLTPPGRLLDVGCGNGRLMVVARKAGWDVKGLERSAERAQRVRERLGAAVVVADLAAIDPHAIDAVKFDVVCLHFGLERVADCVAAMTKLRVLLGPAGHLLLELSNPRSAASRTGSAVNLFARGPFELLLRRTGFDLVRWEPYSDSPLANLLCKFVPVGRYARVLIRKQIR